MDVQVQQALLKWPNVPHCYGWLGLDARGRWRMRDLQAQTLALLGDSITNPTLCGFINRNYQADASGRYFFQNGPQRVYVELESTPYIARFDPQQGWVLHTGVVLECCDAVWMTEQGQLVLVSAAVVAQIDDRDMVAALACLYMSGQAVSDGQLLEWLEQPQPGLSFLFQGQPIAVNYIQFHALVRRYGLVAHPE